MVYILLVNNNTVGFYDLQYIFFYITSLDPHTVLVCKGMCSCVFIDGENEFQYNMYDFPI